tara:strand:+ start:155 stop:343 length:189 start_codon:yes stop_codon:yes gene_type:complete
MKVGDLVRIRDWCKDKGKVAIVSELASWGQDVKIQIIEQDYKEIWARKKNLELVPEVCREIS